MMHATLSQMEGGASSDTAPAAQAPRPASAPSGPSPGLLACGCTVFAAGINNEARGQHARDDVSATGDDTAVMALLLDTVGALCVCATGM